MKYIQNVTDVAVLAAVAVFLTKVGVEEILAHRHNDVSRSALIGQTITLPGVQFPPQRQSLVLATSAGCHYCEESEPFYRDLAAKSEGKLNVVAVLPQPQAEAQAYIKQAAIPQVQVVSSRLESLGIQAIPTLMLVDGNGKVQDAWVGELDERAQQQVIARASL